MSKLEKEVEKALKNVEEDRRVAKQLLSDLIDYISVSNERHIEAGTVAAKYLETLQRSNEQVVKIVSVLQKESRGQSEGLSSKEKEDLFDIIKKESA
tara:strand:+ start:34799 stop:35089 length:291 start_codon:yes stop_codon:yes gene_type:complete